MNASSGLILSEDPLRGRGRCRVSELGMRQHRCENLENNCFPDRNQVLLLHHEAAQWSNTGLVLGNWASVAASSEQ